MSVKVDSPSPDLQDRLDFETTLSEERADGQFITLGREAAVLLAKRVTNREKCVVTSPGRWRHD